jgi:hypothetical protein
LFKESLFLFLGENLFITLLFKQNLPPPLTIISTIVYYHSKSITLSITIALNLYPSTLKSTFETPTLFSALEIIIITFIIIKFNLMMNGCFEEKFNAPTLIAEFSSLHFMAPLQKIKELKKLKFLFFNFFRVENLTTLSKLSLDLCSFKKLDFLLINFINLVLASNYPFLFKQKIYFLRSEIKKFIQKKVWKKIFLFRNKNYLFFYRKKLNSKLKFFLKTYLHYLLLSKYGFSYFVYSIPFFSLPLA